MSEEHPLHVLVGTGNGRRRSKLMMPHVWNSDIPTGAFVGIDDDIYVSTPEFVYLQLAADLDEVELARLATELCGTYNLRMGAHYTERSEPLTTKRKLESYLSRSKGAYGVAKASTALQWVCDGSASPQETNLMLALCLPKRLGGYGLSLPEMNPEIEVGDRLSAYIDGDLYKPDLIWHRTVNGRRVRVTAEYDSHECHDEAAEAEATRIRRNSFKTMGVLVTSINCSQMGDADAFLRAARQIARDMGIWRPEPSMSEVLACGELLDKLADEHVG